MKQTHELYLKEKKEKLEKLELIKSILPELTKCDEILNRHCKPLFSLFDDVKKDWDYGQHLKLKSKNGQEFKILSTTNISGLISQNEFTKQIDDDTLILSEVSHREFRIFRWVNRHDPTKWSFVLNNKKDIEISGLLSEQLKKTNISIYDGERHKISSFLNQSLVPLCLKKTRSLGGKNGSKVSNQNSETQSKRKSNKIVNGMGVKMIFDCPNRYTVDIKNKLDSYKISVTYGFQGTYRTFVRQLEKGTIELEKTDRLHSLTCSLINVSQTKSETILDCNTLDVSTSQVNNTIVSNSLNLNSNYIYKVLTRDVDTSKDNTFNIIGDDTSLEEHQTLTVQMTTGDILLKEYQEWCLTVPEEGRWSFEEYINLT